MINAGVLGLAALASCALAEVAQYGYHVDSKFAPAVVARDSCSELPQLCTDLVMLQGMATMLTYLCPEPTALSTVHVTQTITTTVTVAPSTDNDLYPTEAPENDPIDSQEPTTTTTVRSTVTEHRTITLFHSHDGAESSLSPPVITGSLSDGDFPSTPSITPSMITESFSEGAPPGTNATSSMLAPTAIYQNTTSHGGYAKPTISLLRGAKASESMIPFTGLAGRGAIPSVVLLIGTMVVAASL
ncbi:hypothetical protein J1614_006216 [Plenodomus biglobosus]|nr:hypothetical protein J1614_006216 [Plenodomus biglobosus]